MYFSSSSKLSNFRSGYNRWWLQSRLNGNIYEYRVNGLEFDFVQWAWAFVEQKHRVEAINDRHKNDYIKIHISFV